MNNTTALRKGFTMVTRHKDTAGHTVHADKRAWHSAPLKAGKGKDS